MTVAGAVATSTTKAITTQQPIATSNVATVYECLCIIICPIAIAYSMGQIIKSVCVCVSVCLSVCVSVRLWALSRSHFLIDFHKKWHRRKNPEK